MTIQALGYLGIGADNLDDWSAFATGQLGMQLVDRGAGSRAFRMDDRSQRVVVDSTLPGNAPLFGWEVADASALDVLAARLEAAGVAVRREPAAKADQRLVGGLISFADPAGNHLEAFYGAQIADEPFEPARDIGGFRTGPLGVGHAVLMVPRVDDVLPFYLDLLGFRVSDYIRQPLTAYFLRVNPRHHSLALFEAGRTGFHHLMVELFSMDDVGRGFDTALGQQDRVAVTLGRHPNDLVTSFYMRTPGNFLIEYGWGGRIVDEATWQPEEMKTVASYWGHDGLMRAVGADGPPPGQHPPAPPARRSPLQVMEGNYEVMTGACPWWDGLTGRK